MPIAAVTSADTSTAPGGSSETSNQPTASVVPPPSRTWTAALLDRRCVDQVHAVEVLHPAVRRRTGEVLVVHPEQLTDRGHQTGLLRDLAGRGGSRRLAVLEPSSRQGPDSRSRPEGGVAGEQHLTAATDQGVGGKTLLARRAVVGQGLGHHRHRRHSARIHVERAAPTGRPSWSRPPRPPEARARRAPPTRRRRSAPSASPPGSDSRSTTRWAEPIQIGLAEHAVQAGLLVHLAHDRVRRGARRSRSRRPAASTSRSRRPTGRAGRAGRHRRARSRRTPRRAVDVAELADPDPCAGV